MPVIANIHSDYKTKFTFHIKRNVIELALQLLALTGFGVVVVGGGAESWSKKVACPCW